MYYYWAYGLIVKSEIIFPELFTIVETDQVDVELILGDIPAIIWKDGDYYAAYQTITSSESKLTIPKVGSYYAGFGKQIIINKEDEADWESVRLFCLSNSFAAILHQRKTIPLHCAAFLHNEQLVLIFGHSGAGKSTILAAMMNRGYQVFSDDVCVPVIDQVTGEVSLFSSYPMLKYWKDTADRMGIHIDQLSRKIRPDMDKYGIYFHDNFIIESRKPVFVFLLEKLKDDAITSLQPLTGVALFQRLEENAYRGQQLGYMNLKREHFNLFTSLANQSKSYLIQRGEQEDSIDFIADLIEQKINEG